MRHLPRYLLFSFLGLILISQYNNCDTYSSDREFLSQQSLPDIECYDFDVDDCSELALDKDLLELIVGNTDPTLIEAGSSRVDIGGDCYTVDFPTNRIQWRLVNLSNNLEVTNSDFQEPGVCGHLGRFQFSILLDTNSHNYDVEHVLEVQIIGYDKEGNPHTNTVNALQTVRIRGQ